MANETPSRPPPPFMANAILNFHFDFLHTSLIRFPLPILEELLWTKQANQLCKLMGQTVDQVVAPTFIEH